MTLSTPLVLGCLWVILAALTALLPIRRQAIPGIPLLITAPTLLVWIGQVHGWIWLAFGLFAFASMFRRPLTYLARRALGLKVELPPEFRK